MSILAVAFALAVQQASPAPARRPITEMDLFRFVWIGNPQVSPDGADVAFVRVTVNKKKDGYESALWIVPADGTAAPRSFTSGPRDTAPRWSPDGRRLAFLRSAEKDGKPQPAQIHLMERGGGEARAITDVPKGTTAPVWSPDGRAVAFTSTTNAKDLIARAKEGATISEAERESDVRVITRAIYRWNGGGYVDFARPSHVWTVAVPAGGEAAAPPRQITSGAFEEEDPVWSADGKRILFTSTRVAEPYYDADDEDLFTVAADGGAPTLVTSIEGSIGAAAPSPDGRRIAFRGTLNGKPQRSYSQPDLFLADVAGAPPRNLSAALDFDVLSGLSGDQRAPRGGGESPIVWTKDGRSLLFAAAEKGRSNLRRLDLASERVHDVTLGDQEVMSYSATADGSRIVALISTATEIGDLFVIDIGGAGLRRLTRVNAELAGELDLSAPEDLWYPSFDGTQIHALVQKPPGFDASRRYPLILNIHGGPHAAYGHTLFHYPGDDHKDLMAGVDELIRRGYVDPSRLGITTQRPPLTNQ